MSRFRISERLAFEAGLNTVLIVYSVCPILYSDTVSVAVFYGSIIFIIHSELSPLLVYLYAYRVRASLSLSYPRFVVALYFYDSCAERHCCRPISQLFCRTISP